ncbi:hypothetical protein C2845_PM05G19470 [Panicum miliaceum]|uniref:Uncharacterized protein n=1 Tax=Panicum miliaceum TaxID=4540 RepID=A0A3L6SZX0_PANMI|nr:hypothetical protein C2845_PM05G19470 [Panicum miliaceum]
MAKKIKLSPVMSMIAHWQKMIGDRSPIEITTLVTRIATHVKALDNAQVSYLPWEDEYQLKVGPSSSTCYGYENPIMSGITDLTTRVNTMGQQQDQLSIDLAHNTELTQQNWSMNTSLLHDTTSIFIHLGLGQHLHPPQQPQHPPQQHYPNVPYPYPPQQQHDPQQYYPYPPQYYPYPPPPYPYQKPPQDPSQQN